MRKRLRSIVPALLCCAAAVGQPLIAEAAPDPEEVVFVARDGVRIIADHYEVQGASMTIVLFHQGGSNARGEYGPIIPWLTENGFSVLAVDQRMGGQRYGGYNRTVAVYPGAESYCEVGRDLEAALNWVRDRAPERTIILWGSSYSASLALRLASRRSEEIAAVLAFSPASGGAMESCTPDAALESLTIPVLLLRPASELQIESAMRQFDLARDNGHETFVADPAVHGSSMLVQSRVGSAVTDTRSRVLRFLQESIR